MHEDMLIWQLGILSPLLQKLGDQLDTHHKRDPTQADQVTWSVKMKLELNKRSYLKTSQIIPPSLTRLFAILRRDPILVRKFPTSSWKYTYASAIQIPTLI